MYSFYPTNEAHNKRQRQCALCRFLHDGVVPHLQSIDSSGLGIPSQNFLIVEEQRFSSLWLPAKKTKAVSWAAGAEPNRFSAVPMHHTLAQRAIWRELNPTIDQRLSTVRDWITHCEDHHQICQITRGRLPIRLLDTSRHDPRLVYSNAVQEVQLRYTTLSHCWGSDKSKTPLRTTRANIEQHQKGIPFSSLPRNFQDAITITQKLGFKYLWIDSLCIVQDSAFDWEEITVNMADIYRGSSLTIAAACSEDAHGGILRPPVAGLLAKIAIKSPAHPHLHFTVRSTHTRFAGEEVKDSPLCRRGWVLQEQILSPRVIYFSQSQIFWECGAKLESEDGVVLENPQFPVKSDRRSGNLHRVWWELISEYSCRKLSFDKDYPAAIAGLVQHFRSRYDRTPLLGLWEESLSVDLAWATEGKGHANNFGFPTWSWLSWNGKITYPGHPQNFMSSQVRAVKHEISWRGEPFITPIKASRLVVSGTFRDIPMKDLAATRTGGLDREGNVLVKHSSYVKYALDNGVCVSDLTSTAWLLLYRRDRDHPDKRIELERFLILAQEGDSRKYRRIGIGGFYLGDHQGISFRKARIPIYPDTARQGVWYLGLSLFGSQFGRAKEIELI